MPEPDHQYPDADPSDSVMTCGNSITGSSSSPEENAVMNVNHWMTNRSLYEVLKCWYTVG